MSNDQNTIIQEEIIEQVHERFLNVLWELYEEIKDDYDASHTRKGWDKWEFNREYSNFYLIKFDPKEMKFSIKRSNSGFKERGLMIPVKCFIDSYDSRLADFANGEEIYKEFYDELNLWEEMDEWTEAAWEARL